MVSSQARREQVALAIERGHSKRRACELMDMARSALAYRSVRVERDQPTLTAMRRLAAQYPRYGYRRIRVFLRREGHPMSRRRAWRVWASGRAAIAPQAAPWQPHDRAPCNRPA